MPESYLTVRQEDPVSLVGSIDGAGNLQILHGSDCLADYLQAVHAVHSDLATNGETIRVKLVDFSHGGASWQLSASHDPGGGSQTWSRGSDHAYCDFESMSSQLDVEITATSNASPPATKTRTIGLKTKPQDGQPDRPPI